MLFWGHSIPTTNHTCALSFLKRPLNSHSCAVRAQVVFNRTDPVLPLFNALLYNRGHNKVSFILDLVKNGYTFTVLPNAWITHLYEEHPFRLPFIKPEDHQVAARANLTDIWLSGWQSG